MIIKELMERNVEIRGCFIVVEICSKNGIEIKEVIEDDWYIEYLDLIMGVKVVSSIDDVIEYINKYGLKYLEVIVIKDYFNV